MSVNILKYHRCRLCLGNDNFQLDIFREDYHQKQILLKIKTCLPIKVAKGDGLPSTICYKCLVLLDTSFEFWKKSFNTEAILKYNASNGGVNPFISDNKPNNTVKFENDQQASNSDVFHHADSEESFLDSLDENVWNSAICQSSWQTYTSNNNQLNSHHEKYDMLSDPDLSEVDEKPQRKDCFPTKPHVQHEKCLENKELEFSEIMPRLKSNQGNIMVKDENVWQNLTDDDDLSKNGGSNPKNRYVNKNLFGGQVTSKENTSTEYKCTSEDFSDLSKIQDTNEDVMRRISFPWQQYKHNHYAKKMKLNQISKYECGVDKSPTVVNDLKERNIQEDTRNLLDLNQCPKCSKILTPSQNLLSHIQSHRE